MFTGIVESIAVVKEVIVRGSNKTFWLESPLASEFKVDQSVSHSGVCLTVEEVNAAMKAASNESFGYTEDEIVSSDVIGTTFGSLFDATQTKVMTAGDKQMVKTVSWYDNEMSYVSQLVRTVNFFAGKISK